LPYKDVLFFNKLNMRSIADAFVIASMGELDKGSVQQDRASELPSDGNGNPSSFDLEVAQRMFAGNLKSGRLQEEEQAK